MLLSFFRTGTGHRVGRRPLATPSAPQISFTREVRFDASSVHSRYGPARCSPPGLIAQERHSGLPCPPRLLRPGFQIAGSPHASAGYDYGAKLRIAPAGLSPASTAASLAAPFPGTGFRNRSSIRPRRPRPLRFNRHCPPSHSAPNTPRSSADGNPIAAMNSGTAVSCPAHILRKLELSNFSSAAKSLDQGVEHRVGECHDPALWRRTTISVGIVGKAKHRASQVSHEQNVVTVEYVVGLVVVDLQ